MKNLLLATDFSGLARSAYEAAAYLSREYGSIVHLVHQAEPPPPLYTEHASSEFPLHGYYEKLREKLEEELEQPALREIQVKPHLLCEEEKYDTLVEFARGEGIDLVVISTHGRTGLAHALLGSFAEQVARRSPVPVLTYRKKRRAEEPFAARSVLVPFDFSENGKAILPAVRFLSEHYGTEARLLHVVADESVYGYWGISGETLRESRTAEAGARQKLQDLREEELPEVKATLAIRTGNPYLEIVREAEQLSADLILMATHGRTGLKHFFFGSVAEKVLRRAPCSVVTVRPEDVQKSQDLGIVD